MRTDRACNKVEQWTSSHEADCGNNYSIPVMQEVPADSLWHIAVWCLLS